MIDLTVIASTFVGTLAGALAATVATFAIARRERPVPIWHAGEIPTSHVTHNEMQSSLSFELSNVGNGAAHSVEVMFIGVEPDGERPFAAILMPGESVRPRFLVEISGEYDYASGKDNTQTHWPSEAQVEVHWAQLPHLAKTRSQRFNLKELTAFANYR